MFQYALKNYTNIVTTTKGISKNPKEMEIYKIFFQGTFCIGERK
jgi:hypothetical protein